MRTKRKVIIEEDGTTFCNDPDWNVGDPADDTYHAKQGFMVECGSCDCYHRSDYLGDCRDDDERFFLV